MTNMERDDAEDLVEEAMGMPMDVVSRLNPPGHDGHNLKLNAAGILYCFTCLADGITVGAVTDYAEFHCAACECPKTCHGYDDGRCLMCGNDCGLRTSS